MELLAYVKWQNVESTMIRTVASLKASGHNVSDHVTIGSKMVEIGSKSSRKVVDYRLSRFGAKMVCLNCDARKTLAMEGVKYFDEGVDSISKLYIHRTEFVFADLLSEVVGWAFTIESQYKVLNYRVDFYLPEWNIVIEYDEPRHKSPFVQKLDMIREKKIKAELNCVFVRVNQGEESQGIGAICKLVFVPSSVKRTLERTGRADLKRALIQFGGQDLIAQTPRTVTGKYVPKEFLDEAYRLLTNGDRQKLIGE